MNWLIFPPDINLTLTSRSNVFKDANRPSIAEAIEQAEVVFLAGGDRCKYTRNFKGTAIEFAIESVQARGGAIGGTSAGGMIQGEWIFNACSDAVTSDDALVDPYEDILFTE
ncbi:MAG: Type 1 glutamine amidotransferase-like domain-containing protein [Xenococcaceae cyanobacterium]